MNAHNENNLPLAKFVRLVSSHLVPEAMGELCEIAGGVFVPIPQTRATAVNMESIQRLQAEAASLVESLASIPPGDEETARLKCRIVMREVARVMKGVEG